MVNRDEWFLREVDRGWLPRTGASLLITPMSGTGRKRHGVRKHSYLSLGRGLCYC